MKEILSGTIEAVIEDDSWESYESRVGLRPSTIKKRQRSAMDAKDAYDNRRPPTSAMEFGTLCHCLLLEGETFDDRYAIYDGVKKGKKYEAFRDEHPGKTLVKTKDAKNATTLAMETVKKPFVNKLLSECIPEVTLLAVEGGVQCKTRIDAVSTVDGKGVLLDAKFTNDVSSRKFGMSSCGFGYHIDMGCRKKWFERATGKKIEEVYLIAAQTTGVPDVVCYRMDETLLDHGFDLACELIEQIKEDIAKDLFPGVDGGNESLDIEWPVWGMPDDIALDWEDAT
ncbi:hypothetical protein KOR42_05760 [Thalassoglobus neptunius]|uniref:Putative exodeoxyribonuclease 8 PDDEXK-like domain-containing protein n=1 Tax=Thalassoglobus neptunius TaxID=1938619 RepID=A0A5C5X348_9PLAN|nr:PD-(D/E)XK nuclease-like domain-containing protein [Thalassoglobus neptunius]TWT57218.1 hypothetical protein KOR42_05760 [Thalassoglobus neptunius]